MTDALSGLAGAAGAAVALGALGWSGWVLAARLGRGTRVSARIAASLVAAFTLAWLLGRLGLALGLFGPAWLILAPAAFAAALHLTLGAGAYARLRADAGHARRVASGLARSIWMVPLAAVAVVFAARMARGLVLPPMGWDAVVYHLTKAGRFVQTGGDVFVPAPDTWGFYEYFPAGGSVLWGWALAFGRDGMWLGPAGGCVWMAAMVGVYAAARRLGARRGPASAAAALVGASPAVASLATVSYVDNIVLASVSLGLALTGAGAAEAALCAAALGLAASVKVSALPLAAAATVVIAVRGVMRRDRWTLWASLVSAGIAAVEYARTARLTGNPLYPISLTFGGHEILNGYAPLMEVLRGTSPLVDLGGYRWYEVFGWILLPWRWPNADFAGLGPGFALVAVLAVAGIAGAWRGRGSRPAVVLATVVALLVVASAASKDALALRTLWASVFSRHLTPLAAALAASAAVVTFRGAALFWIASVVVGAWLAWPRGWGAADLSALGGLAPFALSGLGAAAAVWLLGRRIPRGRRAVLATALAAVPVVVCLPAARAEARYPIWASTLPVDSGAYDYHPMDALAVRAWPLWERLDREAGARVAVACGWDGRGHSWYLFPLMGSRLQNTILYVPPTIDGSVVDYRDVDALQHKAQLRAWLRRLVAERIDWIVTLTPSPPERGWMERLPDVFPRVWGTDEGDNFLYRLDREAARKRLDEP